jgi:transglutaminase-like putative cysteine protease
LDSHRRLAGLDPTHNQQIDATYIKIGTGRDYADVPPVSGYYKGTLERKLEVDVQIDPISMQS